jgi:maltooligosyltrehalose trehalohydrolase
MLKKRFKRRYPAGAELIEPGRTSFRVWAPDAAQVEIVFEKEFRHLPPVRLNPEPDGYFSGEADAGVGALYRIRLDANQNLHPDPVSRAQPFGVHESSMVIDPHQFSWSDHDWKGVSIKGQVIYEMHIGTFTPEGTWRAASKHLRDLHELGITVLEIMPVAEFPGKFGWGYDGVDLFAPSHLYGSPEDFREFVNEAHRQGLAVILDVVYNHLGPEGNYLECFSRDYFTDRYENEWGKPFNFDGPNSKPVREFFVMNACYWIEEFHLDGFRFDATQTIFDNSPEHLLAEISRNVREAAGGRDLLLIGENEPQLCQLIHPAEEGGYGLDALWNDDFHHSASVALTGRKEAYYTDYNGQPQEFISAAKRGFLFQGQHYIWQGKRRGTCTTGISPAAFVTFLDNHDQIANSASGLRCHAETLPGRHRVLTALLLLGPWTPMLFQGQEFSASTPFFYFTDLEESLREPVRKGRVDFLKQFPSIATPEMEMRLPIPHDPAVFQRCKLNHSERDTHSQALALHRDLLRIRRETPAFSKQEAGAVDGAVLSGSMFALRFFHEDQDRLLMINLGAAAHLRSVPEPLIAPPASQQWSILWSSNSPAYGGTGTPELERNDGWHVPAECAVVLGTGQQAC